MKRLIQDIHDSPYRGVFHEVGVGMELTASLLRVPGASKTVIGAHCDYAGLGKPAGTRAVSFEYAQLLAMWAKCEAAKTLKDDEPNHNVFGMAVSAVDYTDRTSHAWIYISRFGEGQDAYMHVNFEAGAFNRERLGQTLGEIGVGFLHQVLLKKNSWKDFCEAFNKNGHYFHADVIYAPGISDIERLLSLTSESPLLYHNGQFRRVVDYLRQYRRIFGGSFDPPHQDHILAGHNSLFLLSTDHLYKGSVTLEDLYHRIRMLDIYNVPVLIMKGSPMFWQKHSVLQTLWKRSCDEPYIYVLGSDAWNVMIESHQYPDKYFMRNHFKDSAEFEIVNRSNQFMLHNDISRDLTVYESGVETFTFSSTAIRQGDMTGLHPLVTKYIKANRLYSDFTKQSQKKLD